MAGVEDGSQADAGLQRGNHDAVHFIVDNVAGGTEVNGVDYFVIAVIFVAIEIFGLASVSWARSAYTHTMLKLAGRRLCCLVL